MEGLGLDRSQLSSLVHQVFRQEVPGLLKLVLVHKPSSMKHLKPFAFSIHISMFGYLWGFLTIARMPTIDR